MTKSYEQHINNIIGQLNGIKNMMSGARKCTDVIVQLKAVKSSVNSLSVKYINENLMDCFSDLSKKDQDKVKKMLTEITNLT